MLKNLLLATCLFLGASAFAADQVVLTKDNTIFINDQFDGHSVAQIAQKARDLDSRTDSSDPIYLVINSPGGSIEDGLELIENLKNLKRPVATVSLFSASMGFQTVESLGPRYITEMGTLMAHRASGMFYGQIPGSLGVRTAFYLKRVQKLDSNAVKRSGGKLTTASWASLIQDEYYCEGQDCIEQGLADKVVSPTCDKSLTGTTTVSVLQKLISGLVVEVTADYDNCPLNTNVLKYVLYVNGEPLFKDGISIDELRALFGKKEKEAKAQAATVSGIYRSEYDDKYNYSTPRSVIESLNKDQMFEIQKMFDDLVRSKQNREIIKGY